MACDLTVLRETRSRSAISWTDRYVGSSGSIRSSALVRVDDPERVATASPNWRIAPSSVTRTPSAGRRRTIVCLPRRATCAPPGSDSAGYALGDLQQGIDREPWRGMRRDRTEELGPHQVLPRQGEVAPMDRCARSHSMRTPQRLPRLDTRSSSDSSGRTRLPSSNRRGSSLWRPASAMDTMTRANVPRPLLDRLRERGVRRINVTDQEPRRSEQPDGIRAPRAAGSFGRSARPAGHQPRFLGPRRDKPDPLNSTDAEPVARRAVERGSIRDARHAIGGIGPPAEDVHPARNHRERRVSLEVRGPEASDHRRWPGGHRRTWAARPQ